MIHVGVKRIKKRILYVAAIALIIGGAFSTYAQLSNQAYVVRTVHVFPSEIEGVGFDNAETLTFQNLDEYAILQDFNQINSATLDIDYRPTTPVTESAESETTESTAAAPATTTEQAGTTTSDQASATPVQLPESENAAVGTTSDETSTSSTDVVPVLTEDQNTDAGTTDSVEPQSTNTTEDQTESSTTDEADTAPSPDAATSPETEPQADDSAAATETEEADASETTPEPTTTAGTTTVLRSVDQLFALAVETITATFTSTTPVTQATDDSLTAETTTTAETSTDTTANVEFAVPTTSFSTLSTDVLSAATDTATSDTSDDVTTSTPDVEPATPTATPDASTTAEAAAVTTEETDEATSSESGTETDASDPATTTTETSASTSLPAATGRACEPNCAGHVLRLGNFGYPLDEGTELSGAQLRLSFAAKHKNIREEIPSLVMNYSFDGGETWSTGGSVVLEDEVSNGLNGGYYLFALPAVADPAALKNLQIELRYDADPRLLESLYVESAWLELFILEPPSEPIETDIDELLADDGYLDSKLSGDSLALPNGEVITFDFTDNNDDETLIIKSDQKTYQGLSETKTYFSVTNISDRSDEFKLQTYFPREAGEVTSLEAFNVNKPRQVVIPEYRPYVYHCAAGWEVSSGAPAPESLTTFSITAATSSAATTSTTTNDTTTTTTNPVSTPDTAAAETATTAPAADTAERETYTCQQTSVERTCDSLEGDETACVVSQKVRDHNVTHYAPGWEPVTFAEGELYQGGFLQRVTSFLGFGPKRKEVPTAFEAEAYVDDTLSIAPGETRYFRMTIAFPPFSTGEYWIEAIGDREYGLLDPFWSSQWQYRLPITIDNTAGSETLTEQQVFLELDSSLTDFWTNVAADGSDIRFVQETVLGNEEDWYGTGWSNRTAITIQASQVDENLTDFPVYVDLADLGSTFFANIQSNGADIRVTEADGQTERPYELVDINTGAETGQLHFNAANISSSTDTTFYVYHGNPNVSGYGPTDPFGAEAVWGSEYLAVFHMEEEVAGRGNAGLYQDSTSNDHDADDELNSSGQTGKLGSGQEVNAQGDASEYILLPSDIVNSESQLTFSYWMQSSESNNQALINGGADNDYLLFLTGGGDTLQLFDGGSVSEGLDPGVDLSDGTWQHVMVSRDASNNQWRIFVNGVEDAGGPVGDTMSALSLASDCLVIGLEQDSSCLNSSDTSQHLNAFVDEVRFRNDVPTAGEVSAMYRNQATTTDFYSVGSGESFTVTNFSELDHWVQHFSTSTDEADIWVQVDSIAASASTTIYLYYGSSGAVSESDEYEPFTYSSPRDLYYVVNPSQTNPIIVYSLIDNNQVSIDGTGTTTLNSGESTSFSTYTETSVITANGPITSRTTDDSSEPVVPIAFASTTHLITTNRNNEDFYFVSPFTTATVDLFEGSNAVETASTTIGAGAYDTFNVDLTDDTDFGILESDEPILAYHNNDTDGYVLYPPTTRDLYGIYSTNYLYGTVQSGSSSVEIYCSNGNSGTTTAMDRGVEFTNDHCGGGANGGDGTGNAIRLTNATAPMGATQEADSDGNESTRFLPPPEFGTRYILPQAAEYVTVACAPRFGTVDIEVQTAGGSLLDSGTCTPSGESPGALNITPGTAYPQGTQVLSTNAAPFYVYYEHTNDDETNTWSAVQARAFNSLDSQPYSFGTQEFNIDAEYEQLAYHWYENVNGATPTSSWSLGDEGVVAENDPISGQGSVNSGDVLRLRMSVQANVATGSASSTAFALQYAEAETCSTASDWQEIGLVGSTTAAFSGFNNSAVDDGTELTALLLASSTVFGSYEEASLSAFLINDIPAGEVAEWDWVITNSNANTNTSYCFRMTRSSGDELVTYTAYPRLETSGPPEPPALLERFDNEHATSLRPTLEFVASDLSGDDLHYYVEISESSTFSTTTLAQNSDTNFTRFLNTVQTSEKSPFTSGQVIRFTPASDLTSSTTYWWRVRAIDPDGSNTFGDWSAPFSFTINESLTVSEWYQTTDDQFETNSLTSATTSGSGSVELDSGASLIGEYGSQEIGNNSTTTISLNNSYTNPVVVASLRYPRSVADNDQVAPRVISKSATDFTVITMDTGNDVTGSSTLDYVVMEAGDYLLDDGGSGTRIFATTTSVSSYSGGAGGNPSSDTVSFPTSFGGDPLVLALVTTNNDPDWIVAHVYSGSSDNNPPNANEVKLYLSDNVYNDGHSSAEDIDVIAMDLNSGTVDGVDFNTETAGGNNVTDAPYTINFTPSFSSTPGTVLAQKITNNGGDGGYAMLDTDNPVTASDVTVVIDEGTSGGRAHGAAEDVAVLAFASSSGNLLRSADGQITSTPIDFDDADVGNAWGEVSWNDTGDMTYRVQYQTGSGFVDIPDSALAGNSTGYTSSPINILGLNTDTYNELRLVASLGGVNPELFDWRVTWGQRVNIPELGDPFNNEKIATTTPTFDFSTTDPQGDDLIYEISWSTDNTFSTGSTTRISSTSPDFSAGSPYASGDTVTFTIPPGDALTDGETYWWRVRAIDPNGDNAFSPWSEADSFTVETATIVSTWFQTTAEQFQTGVLSGVSASTTGDLITNDSTIGEYGSVVVDNGSSTVVATQRSYNDPVVVTSVRYSRSGPDGSQRVSRILSKTSDSFIVLADNFDGSVSGTTTVDYLVIEAGDWTIEDGGSGTRIVADTVDVSVVVGNGSIGSGMGGTEVTFDPPFSPSAPAVISNVASNNDASYIFSSVYENGTDNTAPPTTSGFNVVLNRNFATPATHAPEEVDYIAIGPGSGTNNTSEFQSIVSGDNVTHVPNAIGFSPAFSSIPQVTLVQMMTQEGGNGGYAMVDTDNPATVNDVTITIDEDGPSNSRNGHANEVAAVLAFESASGLLTRENTDGVMTGAPILFSDGFGPKFAQFIISSTTPGSSTVTTQVQYRDGTGAWLPIPNSQIPGNSVGTTSSPVNLADVDVGTYEVIRLVSTLVCDGTTCPTLDDWAVEWSEGVPISGTIQEYDRVTDVTSGTVRVAVNGLPGSTGTIQGDGTWTINNVTAFDGDTVTVWVDGAAEANEAVSVFTYDGVGDMTGIELYEQHLTISADENGTTTNADLAAYDNSVSGDEDIFFDVDGNNDLTVCATGSCTAANLYVGPGDVYIPDSGSSGNVTTHDLVNDGTVDLGGNTARVSGSWDNNATMDAANSTVIFTATTSTEIIDDSGGTLEFGDVTFGETLGTATWQTLDPLDLSGDLAVNWGTLNRASSTITLAGDLTTGANGFWAGVASTTFTGTGNNFWSDANPVLQDVGNVLIDGSPKTVLLSSDVAASSVTIGNNDTLNGGGTYTLNLTGDFENLGTFTPQTSTIAIVGSSTNAFVTPGASSLFNLTASTTGGAVSFGDTTVTILGDLTIATGTLTAAASTTIIGGSLSNTGGDFAHNNGLVRFTSTASETIELQGTTFLNQFYDVSFTGSGDWTFLDTNATTTNTWTQSNGTVVMPTGTLTVGRDFTTSGAGSFDANGGEVVFLARSTDPITTNGSALNDVRIRQGSPVRGGAYPAAWLYRDVITIDATNIDDDLTDFPVYLDLADFGSDFFTLLGDVNGGDIRVTAGDGVTEVPREIVAVDTGAETGEMYFQAPSLSSTTNTTFYLYYGNSSASDYAVDDPFGAENVWDADYLAVYHMEQDPPLDSTSFNRDTAYVGDTPAVESGRFGNAVRLTDNAGNDYIDLQSDLDELDNGSEVTVSGWVNFTADNEDEALFIRELNVNSDPILMWKNDVGSEADDTYTWNVGDTGPGGNRVDAEPDGVQDAGRWQWVAGSMNGAARYIYVEDNPRYSDLTGDTTIAVNTNGAAIGYWGVGANDWDADGLFDEFRISQIERSEAWLRAEYRNMATSTDFYTLTSGAGTQSRIFAEGVTTATGDVVIESANVQFPTTNFNIAGSLDNNATFNAGSGAVTFNATTSGHTVSASSSSFYNLVFDGAGGSWTIDENATATNAITLTDGDVLTVDSGVVLESTGAFTNDMANASTTWTGATLRLSSGNDITINSKDSDGDDYETLQVTDDGTVRMWNSTATTYDTLDTSAIYSQDHAGADGDLYIFGDYEQESGTEYWAYETDWDGADLVASGTERQANVRIANGATVIASSSNLQITGTSTASTTVDAQSGSYTLIADNATVTAQYFTMTGGDADGFQLLGSTSVATFSDGAFTIPTSAAAMTIASSTVDTNPEAQYFDIDFVTGGGNINVALSGSPSSFWWFRDGAGDRYGEAFDDAGDGDPGSIRWDDSNFQIDISGTVYSDAGVTTLGATTCDGTTNNVRVVVDGGVYTDAVPCDGSGAYTLSNVSYDGDSTIVVYLDTNGGIPGSVITRTPTADITDLDIYANRVITRHETTDPMSTARLAQYDESDDSDLRYVAATGTEDTLTVRPDNELFIFANKTFEPNGPVTLESNGSGNSYDGSLTLAANATFVGFSTSTYSVGGSVVVAAGADLATASSSFVFTATTTGKEINGSSTVSFNTLSFTGTGGEWSLNTDVTAVSDVLVADGTLTGASDLTVTDGWLYGDGTVDMTGGTVTINSDNTFGGTTPWTFNNLVLGDGLTSGVTTPASSATTTVTNQLTIAAGHFLDAQGSLWNLAGSGTVFIEDGQFLEGTSTVQYSGATPDILRTTYRNLTIDPNGGGSVLATAPVTGLQVLGNLRIGEFGTATLDVTTNDPLLAIGGDLYIGPSGTLDASDTNTTEAFGSWDNDGTFTANGGLVEFQRAAGGATIAAGGSSFADLAIIGDGSFTITEDATSTGSTTLDAGDFTLQSGRTLAVGDVFTNVMADGDTTWTGTTLRLYGNQAYTINDKTVGDTYETIVVTNTTHPRLWNSTAVTVTTDAGSSLYSMDHANSAGDLYIFGDFVNDSYADHWSYSEDFDGTTLGVPRLANVLIEDGGSVTYTGGSLTILGSSTASTSIAAQGSGPYTMRLGGTTDIDLSYYTIREIDSAGLTISDTPNVVDLSYGDFEIETGGGSGITVGGTAIDANPALNFTDNRFATTTAIAGVNVTATGTSVSSWRFINVSGNLEGEAFDDDPGGNPGYIVWEDSLAIIDISGFVYQNDQTSTSTICDGVTPNIALVVGTVGATTFASTTCDTNGAYSFTGVNFGASDTLLVYIDGETGPTVQGANVTRDPISNISNMDIYENHVITRHEGGSPMTIDAMAVYDSSEDADLPYTAVTGGTDTLTLSSDTALVVWDAKTFAPGGDVTLSGGGSGGVYDGTLELFTDATFDAASGESHSVGGDLLSETDATFDADTSTFTFTSDAIGRTIDTNDNGFHNLTFTGTGQWSIADSVGDINNNFTIASGTVVLPAGTTTVSGSFTNSGGQFTASGGTLVFDAPTAGQTVTFGGSDPNEVRFAGPGAWTITDTNATTTDSFTVASGTVTLPSGTLAVGGDFVVESSVAHAGGVVLLTNTTGGNVITLNSNDLTDLTVNAPGGDYTLTDASATFLGSLTLATGTLSVGTGTVTISDSFDVSGGVFNNGTGTLLFNSADGGEFIDPGANDLYNVVIAGAGGWTVADDATTTNNFTLSNAGSFTFTSGRTLYVGGAFINEVGGAATDWTNTTVILDGANEYEMSPVGTAAEVYGTLIIESDSDISSWNTSAATTSVASTSSWYSQNHAGNNGDLNIYGDYQIGTTTEFWSAATNFNGDPITARPVSVSIADGSTVTVSGSGLLEILGTPSATTTITNQGTGAYSWLVTGGTLNAQYYSVTNLDSAGLQLSGSPTITSLSNGYFTQTESNQDMITLASTTINANASLEITNTGFAAGGFSGGDNVVLDATTTNSWSFTGSLGDLWGENFDVDGLDACGSVRWDDSDCLLVEQTGYRWRNDDGGEGAAPGTWYDSDWSERQRIRISNNDATAYASTAVKFTLPYNASFMQPDFDDVRVTEDDGVTLADYWVERVSGGVSADIWVRIPSLPADGVAELYLYYGNPLATAADDPTGVFSAVEDFESVTLAVDYDGDTGLFNTGSTFAYGGSLGLDTSGNETDRATDGIGRTDITVSQGDTIRYLQYVDTTSGANDEACTLFGVQGLVTANNNYAVCVQQPGTDRITLAKDVVETPDYSGTVLATTTVSLSTGWYEFIIDWETDNSIDVTMRDDSGTVVATTSATDSSSPYTSGTIGFTYWFQHGGWDSYVAWPRTETEPTVYLGARQQDGGASWAATQDTPGSGFTIGETARLRVGVDNTGLDIIDQNFQLEFAPKLTAPTCGSVSAGSYAEVPVSASCGSSALCMATSTNVSNGDPTTDHLLGDFSEFVAGEIVTDPSNETANYNLNQNRYSEFEYAINLTTNAVNDAYCFRLTNDGAELDSYDNLPELSLEFDPTLDTVIFNDGLDIDLTPGTTTTVVASTTVTDLNGVGDLDAATTTFYTTAAGPLCTADDNDCYIATSSCSFFTLSLTQAQLLCTAEFAYHATATDLDGANEWFAFMEVRDQGGASDFDTSTGRDVNTMRAFDVENAIAYGTVDIDEDTGSFNPQVDLVNLGNESIDVEVSGTDMTDGVTSVIPAGQQRYSTSTFTYSSCTGCQTLSVTPVSLEVDLDKPVTTSPRREDALYWGIEVPFGTASNPHSGTNFFTAVAD